MLVTINTLDEVENLLKNPSKDIDTIKMNGRIRFDKEELDFLLTNTSVKKIIATPTGTNFPNTLLGQENTVYVGYPYNTLLYHDCILEPETKPAQSIPALTFTVPNLDESLQDIKRLYSSLEPKPTEIQSISIADSPDTPFLKEPINIKIEDGQVTTLKFNSSVTPATISNIVKSLEEDGYPPAEIVWKCENKTYDGIDELIEIDKKTPIKVQYDTSFSTNLDNFIGMRATIDWYKSLINEKELSPAEKLLYAFDIIKSFQYQASPNKQTSRNIPEIIETGNIVCIGYVKFLNQLLEEVGIKSDALSVEVIRNGQRDGHARNIVRLDDDKYDIHGLFTLDATWDARKQGLSLVRDEENLKRLRIYKLKTDKTIKDYDGLTLYQNFLVPIEKYSEKYPNETLPGVIRFALERNFPEQNLSSHENYLDTELYTKDNPDMVTKATLEKLFGTKNFTAEVDSYTKAPKPSLETFTTLLETVRKEEGYSATETSKNISDTVELNQMLDSINPTQTFFKEEQHTK